MDVSDAEYRQLLEFRSGLRRFLHWSEEQVRAAGLTPAQHQLLLAVRGHDDPNGPTIGEIAGHLQIRHHSAVELVARAESAGLVDRAGDVDDHRVVRLRLSSKGAEHLASLSVQHLEELRRLGPSLRPLWAGLD